MKVSAIFNTLAVGMIGVLLAAYGVPSFVEGFKKGYNQAIVERMDIPWTVAQPRQDGPGTFLYGEDRGRNLIGLAYVNAAGLADRDGLPALTIETCDTHAAIKQAWFKNGELHRENGPAVIDYDPKTGEVVGASWYYHGRKTEPWQRASLPAGQPG